MKKLMSRARQAIHTSKSSSPSSPADSTIPPPTQEVQPVQPLDSLHASSGNGSKKATSDACLHLSTLAQSITSKWETDHQLDVTPDMRELWTSFCDAGMQPHDQQQLVDLVKSTLEKCTTEEDINQHDGPSIWKDLPQFKPVAEQKLRESFMADMEPKSRWIRLNHLLARISTPPASIYDLRMVCLWNMRDVLETSSVAVTVGMLKILMLWLGGHIHWLQLQILRAHSKRYPDDALISLEVGDLPNKVGMSLQPIVNLERLSFWRQRLQELHDAANADAAMKFYTNAVLSLLEVGIAAVDEWKEELPLG